jgi:hypothetical protein
MADPADGGLRLNNGTASSVTAIAIDDLTAQTGNPDASAFINTWADSTNGVKGQLRLAKGGDPTVFALYNITGLTDNTGWVRLDVSHVASSGSFSSSDDIYVAFTRTGDQGSAFQSSDITGQTAGTISLTDEFVGADVSNSGALVKYTTQKILNAVNLLTETTSPDKAADFVPIYDTSGNVIKKIKPDNLAGGAGLTLLGTYTASSDASVDIGSGLDLDAAIDSTYEEYLIIAENIVPATDSRHFLINTSSDGGSTFDSGSGNYSWVLQEADAQSSSVGLVTDLSDIAIRTQNSSRIGNGTGENAKMFLWLHNPSETSLYKKLTWDVAHITSNGYAGFAKGTGVRETTSKIDAIKISLNSSTNIASGEFKLYGVKK